MTNKQTKNSEYMKTEDLKSSLLFGLETAKTLADILKTTLENAHTLEKMCDGVVPGQDDFCDTIGAASLDLIEAASILSEAVQKATPSQSNL